MRGYQPSGAPAKGVVATADPARQPVPLDPGYHRRMSSPTTGPLLEDGALMFEAAGQHVERTDDYPSGHEWDPDELGALMADFFGRTCNE